jgi:acyl-CoA reductase-like NAD-dependent aldehyde dehydrogenase
LTQTDNGFSDISEEELAARNRAVAQANTRAGALDIVIDTMAKRLRDEPPPPDVRVAQEATRAAQTRLAWARWHAEQARRHRRTLADLIVHHEAEARRLGGPM